MIDENDVRSKIAALLNDNISLDDFSRWIVDQSWNMHQDSAPAAIDLVSDIQMLIAERDDSVLNATEMRRAFLRILNNFNLEVRVYESLRFAPFIAAASHSAQSVVSIPSPYRYIRDGVRRVVRGTATLSALPTSEWVARYA